RTTNRRTEPVGIVVQLLHARRLRAAEAARARLRCVAVDSNDRGALPCDREAAGGLAACTVRLAHGVEQASRCAWHGEAPTIATLRRACHAGAGHGQEPRALTAAHRSPTRSRHQPERALRWTVPAP